MTELIAIFIKRAQTEAVKQPGIEVKVKKNYGSSFEKSEDYYLIQIITSLDDTTGEIVCYYIHIYYGYDIHPLEKIAELGVLSPSGTHVTDWEAYSHVNFFVEANAPFVDLIKFIHHLLVRVLGIQPDNGFSIAMTYGW